MKQKLISIFLILGTYFLLAMNVQAQKFPLPNRPISMIVPFGAGGPTDVAARLLANSLEKELGTQVVVINKPGASTQIGVTQIAISKPDGYTIGFVSLPQLLTVYLDPERKTVFKRKDLQPLAMHVVDPVVIVVKSNSPFNNLQQMLEFAKANPNKLKAGDGGFMGTTHLAWLELSRQSNTQYSLVHFDGSAPSSTALLGEHIDILLDTVAGVYNRVKSGEFKVLGVMDSQENTFLPNVKTFTNQGLKLEFAASRGLVAPAGTPKEVVDTLTAAIQKSITTEDHKKRMTDMGQTLRYMSPVDFSTFWISMEKQIQPLMDLAKNSTKN